MEFCTDQESRLVEIRKGILPQCSEKQSENLPEQYLIETSTLSQKELFTPISSPSSLPKTRIFAHQSERSIFSERAVEKSYCSDSHCSKSFCSKSLSSKSAKSKAPSLYSSKPSEKKPSALSKFSYSVTGSLSVSDLSVSDDRKTTEHAKLAAKQVEECAQRQLKLLHNSIVFKWFRWKFNTKMGKELSPLILINRKR